jgi:hypothetical protein
MDVHALRIIDDPGISPDMIYDLIAGEHLPGIIEKQLKHPVFDGSKVDIPAVSIDPHGFSVDGYLSKTLNLLGGITAGEFPDTAPQLSFDS